MKLFLDTDYRFKNKYLFQKYSLKNLTLERIRRLKQLQGAKEQLAFLLAEYRTLELLDEIYHTKAPKIFGKAGEKPYLVYGNGAEDEISFSRSYGGEYLALAFGRSPLGVDCELLLKRDPLVMEYFFTKKERRFVTESTNPDLVYTVIWTRKESVLKQNGKGLRFPFHKLEMLEDGFSEEALGKIPKGYRGEIKTGSLQKTEGLYLKSFVTEHVILSVAGEARELERIYYEET